MQELEKTKGNSYGNRWPEWKHWPTAEVHASPYTGYLSSEC